MNESIKHLRKLDRCGYSCDGPWMAEPTALACLALATSDDFHAALRFANQLADSQLDNGAVTANKERDSPAWTTSLAILAWLVCDQQMFQANINRALDWALATHGRTQELNDQIGHDTTILGWSWAAETHAWMEPTCMFVIALKAAGLGDHVRVREGVRLVTDRLLPEGGSNFGSTFVLGQATLPQVESTGLAMLALGDEVNADPRVEKSLRHLEQNLNTKTPTASLCYGLFGLSAHDRRPALASDWIAAASYREIIRGPSAFKLALLVLAGMPVLSWVPNRLELAPA